MDSNAGNNSQKIENLFNLALNVSDEERILSDNLNVGYNEAGNDWTLIIKYNSDIELIRQLAVDSRVVELSGGYAIARIRTRDIDYLASLSGVEYIEKPKTIYWEIERGISASCINSARSAGIAGWLREAGLYESGLYGDGIIVAVIDTGIDYLNSQFMDENGKTRILEIWDQTSEPVNPPEGYYMGRLYTRDEINEAISAAASQGRNAAYRVVSQRDIIGHGTHVAGICAGNFAADKRNNIGVATKSNIIAVKLGMSDTGFPRTTELMQAINYVVNRAIDYAMPVAVNISFGNTYGSHDGTSLIETYIDTMANIGRTTIVIGSGNDGAASGHAGGYVREGEVSEIELSVDMFESVLNIQIWKSFSDVFNMEIIAPDKSSTGILSGRGIADGGIYRYNIAGVKLLVYYGEPSPYSRYQEIYIDFIPDNGIYGMYITPGVWSIKLTGVKIVTGRYDMWLPSEAALNTNTGFLRPDPQTTLTIPSTASKAITVGAYDAATMTYADFSGRGFTRETGMIKPDIVAPGVGIVSCEPGGGLGVRSGTSVATPFVTGSAAILMSYGIVYGNDYFLYGEKVKAYLIKGARQLQGERSPSERTGWGALCLRDSLPL